MRHRYLVAAGVVALAGAAAALTLVAVSDHTEDKLLVGSLAATTSLAFVFSGLVALWRRPENRTGLLLAGTGYVLMLGALTTANDPWVHTLGWLVNSAGFGVFGHLILAFPTGRLERRFDRFLVALIWVVLIVPALALLLVGGTGEVCRSDCPESTIAVWPSEAAAHATLAASSVGALVVIGLVLFALARRWRGASPALRRTLWPVFAASGVTLLLLVAGLLVGQVDEDAGRPFELMAIAALATVPISFLAGILRSRLARIGVADLLVGLGRGVPLREALADALRDPSLEVVYWLPEARKLVWHDGSEFADEGGPRLRHDVVRNGQLVGAILHDPSLAEERELVDAVAAAAGLWLENERLATELRAQYRFLETIVDAAPSLLCSLDPDGRIANLNEAARRASGYEDEEEVRGRPFWDVFVAPEERERVRRGFERGAAEPATDTFEHTFEHTFANAQREELTIAWSTAPIRGDDGAVLNVICGGLDITERRLRELELEVERDFADTVANTIPILLVGVWDDATVNDYGPNPAFEETLGWAREETIGRSLLDHVHPDDRQLAATAIASAANGIPSEPRESRWLHRDGSERLVAWSAKQILGLEGRTVVLVSGADVTEQRRQEEEIRRSRARIVEAGDEARRVLERNLHDGAQQRLVALALSLRLAQAKLDADPAAAGAILESARDELAAALDELRELARGIHPAVLTDRGLAAALEALASRLPIPVELAAPERALPRPVEAAAYYVVAEALANVIKYAHASTVSVRVDTDEACVRVEVVDDGVGGADPAAGTGLRGLADRVEALEGSLTVVSPPGSGTRIGAEIPLAAAHVEATALGAPGGRS